MSIPTTTKQWNIVGQSGFDDMKFSTDVPVPPVGDSQVLVKIHAVTLNYRDLIIPKGQYPFAVTENVVPGSDGAGTVIAVGKHVRKWKAGDKVITLFNQGHQGGPIDPVAAATGLGGAIDGTLREVGAFAEDGVVAMPEGLSFAEAASLTCAGLTAWNALFGYANAPLKQGDWVLTQGTGGVSIFAVQFAKAAGARVVATTSSAEKAKLLQKLGADHILNYRETPEWGAEARKLTGGRGFDHIVEVAGPASMKQDMAAIRMEGVISIIGFVGGPTAKDGEPGFLNCLQHMFTARGILVGSRLQMEDMVRAVAANPQALKPVVDGTTFSLQQAREAYEYMWDQKHQGNVAIIIE